eukprot:scaffold252477_cov16-Tisochrysis_lutea.AAC.2
MKRRYFEQKRRDQMEREKGLKPMLPPAPSANQARFTGGSKKLPTSIKEMETHWLKMPRVTLTR